MFASLPSAVLFGAEGHAVSVEIHVSKGLPGFHIVGLPDESIRESRDRVRAAILSCGLPYPDIKITVGLAPSPLRKSGSGLDLAIAVGILVASGEVPAAAVDGLAFVGELGLDGSLRPVAGVAPMVGVLGELDVVVPVESGVEARVAALGTVRLVRRLDELVGVLRDAMPWPGHQVCDDEPVPSRQMDLADVQGQPLARRALEIAAAGGHHTLFVGPPGAGKTMLAARLPGLLPGLDRRRALEATMIHSAAGARLPAGGLVVRPPFRSPHHTSSLVSLVGGGSHSLRPGEISLSHCGVLFLDEIAEFHPSALDGLRQPLEERVVHVSRAHLRATLPADFLLVAAMNPCPCGGGAMPGGCDCNPANINRYARRLSGPLLDRFDLRVNVHRPGVDDLLAGTPGESTAVVAARVARARQVAVERQGVLNSALAGQLLDRAAPIDDCGRSVLRDRLESQMLSGRGYHRVRRVARTISDLRDEPPEVIPEEDIHLALGMRTSFERALQIGRAA